MNKHISEDGQIRDCHAKTPEGCTAKGPNGEKAEHFTDNDMDTARKRSEELQEGKYGRVPMFNKCCPVNKKNAPVYFKNKEDAMREAERLMKDTKIKLQKDKTPEEQGQEVKAKFLEFSDRLRSTDNRPTNEELHKLNDELPEKYRARNFEDGRPYIRGIVKGYMKWAEELLGRNIYS